MQLRALNMMFISVAAGQWSGSPTGREHFARLGLTSPLLSPTPALSTHEDILECGWRRRQGG